MKWSSTNLIRFFLKKKQLYLYYSDFWFLCFSLLVSMIHFTYIMLYQLEKRKSPSDYMEELLLNITVTSLIISPFHYNSSTINFSWTAILVDLFGSGDDYFLLILNIWKFTFPEISCSIKFFFIWTIVKVYWFCCLVTKLCLTLWQPGGL